jgi:hypothetical protein
MGMGVPATVATTASVAARCGAGPSREAPTTASRPRQTRAIAVINVMSPHLLQRAGSPACSMALRDPGDGAAQRRLVDGRFMMGDDAAIGADDDRGR